MNHVCIYFTKWNYGFFTSRNYTIWIKFCEIDTQAKYLVTFFISTTQQ